MRRNGTCDMERESKRHKRCARWLSRHTARPPLRRGSQTARTTDFRPRSRVGRVGRRGVRGGLGVELGWARRREVAKRKPSPAIGRRPTPVGIEPDRRGPPRVTENIILDVICAERRVRVGNVMLDAWCGENGRSVRGALDLSCGSGTFAGIPVVIRALSTGRGKIMGLGNWGRE